MNPVSPVPQCRFSSSKAHREVHIAPTFCHPKDRHNLESCLSPNQRSDMGLVLSRRVKQRIYIKRGDRVVAEIEVSKIRGNTVFLYIDADEDLYITRDKDWSEKRLDSEVPVSRLHD